MLMLTDSKINLNPDRLLEDNFSLMPVMQDIYK